MTVRTPQEVTQLLHAWRDGDGSALDELMPLVYKELHRLAHHYMLVRDAVVFCRQPPWSTRLTCN